MYSFIIYTHIINAAKTQICLLSFTHSTVSADVIAVEKEESSCKIMREHKVDRAFPCAKLANIGYKGHTMRNKCTTLSRTPWGFHRKGWVASSEVRHQSLLRLIARLEALGSTGICVRVLCVCLSMYVSDYCHEWWSGDKYTVNAPQANTNGFIFVSTCGCKGLYSNAFTHLQLFPHWLFYA